LSSEMQDAIRPVRQLFCLSATSYQSKFEFFHKFHSKLSQIGL